MVHGLDPMPIGDFVEDKWSWILVPQGIVPQRCMTVIYMTIDVAYRPKVKGFRHATRCMNVFPFRIFDSLGDDEGKGPVLLYPWSGYLG